MTVLTRNQFAEHWNTVKPGLGDADSGLWAYERSYGPESQWFVSIRPIKISTINKQEFWSWCKRHCPTGVNCYSASDDTEWWGFGNKQEMSWWILRWL